ncbi:hypothetical protein MXB_5706, partial [Myxobolus squamalis]
IKLAVENANKMISASSLHGSPQHYSHGHLIPVTGSQISSQEQMDKLAKLFRKRQILLSELMMLNQRIAMSSSEDEKSVLKAQLDSVVSLLSSLDADPAQEEDAKIAVVLIPEKSFAKYAGLKPKEAKQTTRKPCTTKSSCFSISFIRTRFPIRT